MGETPPIPRVLSSQTASTGSSKPERNGEKNIGVEPKNRGILPPKMDGENHGSNPIKIHELGGKNPYSMGVSTF